MPPFVSRAASIPRAGVGPVTGRRVIDGDGLETLRAATWSALSPLATACMANRDRILMCHSLGGDSAEFFMGAVATAEQQCSQ